MSKLAPIPESDATVRGGTDFSEFTAAELTPRLVETGGPVNLLG